MWLILVSKIIHQHKWSTLQNLTTGFSFWNSDICWLVSAEGNPRPYIAKLVQPSQVINPLSGFAFVISSRSECLRMHPTHLFHILLFLNYLPPTSSMPGRKSIVESREKKNNLPSISYNHIISYDVLLVFVRHKKNQSKTVWLILININVD